MGKVYCLMGKSASGKDTVYRRLLEEKGLNLKRVIPYTTRPMRAGEKDGDAYFFCSEEEADEAMKEGLVLEMRSYNTVCGVWKYFTENDGQIDLSSGEDYLMIGTPEACRKLRDCFGEENVEPICLELEDGMRLERALRREQSQLQPNYREMCRRYLADEDDFSPRELKKAGVRKKFDNTDLEETIRDISDYMKRQREL